MEEDDFLLVEHGLRTTRFLIEAQMRLLAELGDAQGPQREAAGVTLRRLLDLEAALGVRAETRRRARGPGRFAA